MKDHSAPASRRQNNEINSYEDWLESCSELNTASSAEATDYASSETGGTVSQSFVTRSDGDNDSEYNEQLNLSMIKEKKSKKRKSSAKLAIVKKLINRTIFQEVKQTSKYTQNK